MTITNPNRAGIGSTVETAEITNGSVTAAKLDETYDYVRDESNLWEFDNNLTDSTGGVNLTDSGSVTYDAAIYKSGSYSYTGNGGANQYASHATFLDALRTDYTKGITFSGWVYCTNTSVGILSILSKCTTAAENDVIRVYFNNTSLLCYSKVGGTAVSLTATIAVNTWYHFVFVLRTNGDSEFYLNGELVDFNYTSNSALPMDGNTTDFFIGVWDDGASFKLQGKIDKLRCFSRSLTSNEAREVYYRDGGT